MTEVAERSIEKTPERYVVSLEDMVENDYPIPSYMADVFEKPLGWMETPAPTEGLAGSAEKLQVLAIDCEMVRYGLLISITTSDPSVTVSYGRWE